MRLRIKNACLIMGCLNILALCVLVSGRMERSAGQTVRAGARGSTADMRECAGTDLREPARTDMPECAGTDMREPAGADMREPAGADMREPAGTDLRETEAGAQAAEISADTHGQAADTGGGGKKIALTFDDGPHPRYTKELLEGLRERNVRVTFFVLGQSAELYPELIKEMAQDGHLIGNHTYSHMQLTSSNSERFVAELQKTDALIFELTGLHTEFVRPPYGAWNTEYEESLNMIPVLWSVDPLDWCCADVGTVMSRVLVDVREDSIILLHDVYESSVQAALGIIDELLARGYEFVTVDEIILD